MNFRKKGRIYPVGIPEIGSGIPLIDGRHGRDAPPLITGICGVEQTLKRIEVKYDRSGGLPANQRMHAAIGLSPAEFVIKPPGEIQLRRRTLGAFGI